MGRPPRRDALGIGAASYYHFTLARAATLLGVRDLDGVNWYAAGEARVVATQRADGAWLARDGMQPGVLETAWSLGFLARASLPAIPSGDRELK